MRESHEHATVSALNTRTMAELYLAQGHPERTKRIVRVLQESQADDASLQVLYDAACALEAELAVTDGAAKPKRRASDKPRPAPKASVMPEAKTAARGAESAEAMPSDAAAPAPRKVAPEATAGPIPPKAPPGARFEIVAEPNSWREKGKQTLDQALAFMVERSARILLRVARKRW